MIVCRYGIFWLLPCLIARPAYAHEEIDLGIAAAAFDKECRAVVTVKNFGRPLPDAFYKVFVSPVVEVSKENSSYTSNPLHLLDKARALQDSGGRLVVVSQEKFTNNPKPLHAEIVIKGHLVDSDERNNSRDFPIDCRPGEGEIPSPAVKLQEFADLKISQVKIDPVSCLATLTIENSNRAKLPENAWAAEKGAALVSIDLDRHEHRPPVYLSELDTARRLNSDEYKVLWHDKNPVVAMNKIQFGIWYVANDPDFENNNHSIDVPEHCQKHPAPQ